MPKQKKGKRGKRKSVNQYWRDFKMLYRRVNGFFVNANDSHEVVKVSLDSCFYTLFYYSRYSANLTEKFINGELTTDYDLDNMPKPKPLAGVDTLLLILTHHWARDESIFRTEDDRLDFACVTLFQAYTGGRPAEFVHGSKNAASQDPLGEKEKNPKLEHPQPSIYLNQADGDCSNYEDDSDAGDEIPDEDLFDDYTNLSDASGYLFDSEDESDTESATEERTGSCDGVNSRYSSDRDRFMTDDEMESYLMEADEVSDPVVRSVDVTAPAEFKEEVRKTKAICYEDICLWIVQNPKPGERDLLAMEVFLRNHKGADKKPKPCACLL